MDTEILRELFNGPWLPYIFVGAITLAILIALIPSLIAIWTGQVLLPTQNRSRGETLTDQPEDTQMRVLFTIYQDAKGKVRVVKH